MITAQSASTTSNPNLTAEEIGKRFLKLIEGLKSREDLSLESTQEVTGLILEPSKNASFLGYSQGLDEGWFYTFTYIPEGPSVKNGIGLDFEHRKNSFSDMTPVCSLDFDYYHNALIAMGFLAEPYYGEISELRSWRYTKFKKSDGAVDMTISIIPQNVVAGEAGRLCVKSIGTLNGR